MEIVAKSTFVKGSPRKVRLVADQIKGLDVARAEAILTNLRKAPCQPLLLVLKQAIGNAINNFKLKKENLKIKTVDIGEGPRLKRVRFVSRGRIHQIKKRLNHINLVLEDISNGKKG
ncbi:50S ribosomal protein L22 [Candidatus Shapirobacteria bacterium CG09_land_8_20_14_0_10_47_13]|uniref:Large ribosomal subunit protein uL22 n=1 Tax=Candidatus Shapirobacteria bacterium CG09_land_8_20_14_0_10_47_13 TaxID=1974481 RepID=A0A2H0WN55_9BACT|nr:MAG: 50S ribosomal protein L22 [Candidatus Shapirobacteria bacterium CG09_land_8_20_14_0_10_47_13]